jgi:hypothetical protein
LIESVVVLRPSFQHRFVGRGFHVWFVRYVRYAGGESKNMRESDNLVGSKESRTRDGTFPSRNFFRSEGGLVWTGVRVGQSRKRRAVAPNPQTPN